MFFFSQLQQSEEAREVEQTDINKVTDEFTVRIGDLEKKKNQVLKVGCMPTSVITLTVDAIK